MHLLLLPASPLHRGCTARPNGTGGQEGSAQTAAIALPGPGCAGEGHTPELPPAPVLSTCVSGGGHRETASLPPVPVMRTGCTGAPPIPVTMREPLGKLTALGLRSPPLQLHGVSPQEPATGSPPPPGQNRGAAGLGGSSQTRSCGPGPPAELEGGHAVSGELDSAGAGAELSRHRGAGVVVGVGVAAGQAGGQRGDGTVAGAPVLQQDVNALLAASSPGVGQRGQAPSVPALHIHPVLCRRESSRSVGTGALQHRGGHWRETGG